MPHHTMRLRQALWLRAGLAAILSVAVLASTAHADSLPNTGAPTGFTINSVAEGLADPTVAQFAPDGRIFVAEKGGKVRIVKNGLTLAAPFYTVPTINTYVDRGLLGMALDPNFATNGYVYLLYTYDNNPGHDTASKTGRLLRVTAAGDKALAGSEQIILGSTIGTPAKPSCENYPAGTDCIPADYFSHGPDTLKFGPDGKLYVSIGESSSYDDVDQRAFRSQNLASYSGKVLRINPDGTGPADNPYYTGVATDTKSKIYSYGFRNPFRLGIHPTTGMVVVGDVGWGAWEELNIAKPGANFGWPCYEGTQQQNGIPEGTTGRYKDQTACKTMYATPPANLTLPAHTYAHPPGSAIVAGMFYTGNNYPTAYKNQFFYGDYARDQIYQIGFDAAGKVVAGSAKTFANNAMGPTSFFAGPEGDVYYTGIITGKIYRVQYSTTNQPPTAIAGADVTNGPTPLTVAFTSGGSFDPEGSALMYSWDFGDGTAKSTAANPTHTFTTKGVFTVTLTVKDAANQTNSKALTITAGQTAPVVAITSPTDATVAGVGQVINFNGNAMDANGPLPANQLHWKVAIQHCPLDSCHAHTVTTVDGATGSFSFPAHDGPFYVDLTLTATNTAGLSTSKTVSVYPVGQKITRSLQFDGINDYATGAKPADFTLQQFTTEAQVKAFTTGQEGGEVISMGDSWMLRVSPTGGVSFGFATGGGWDGIDNDAINILDGLWHHVAATKTATQAILYVDGAVVAQANTTGAIEYTHGTSLVVGKHGNGSDLFNFNGAIDELRVWSAPRTGAEIAQYKAQTLPAAELTKLVGYYKADEGNGTNVIDESSNHTHPLTLLNGANWTVGAPLSDPPTAPTMPLVNSLTDNFTGTTLATTKWGYFGTPAQTTQNGTLNIALPTAGTGYFGIASKQRYDLTGNSITVEVPQTTTGGVGAETQLVLELNNGNRLVIIRGKNSMVFRHRANSVNSDTFAAYNASTMRWWRLRESAGTIYFETSPDATTWTTRRSVATGFNITQLQVVLNAGVYETTTNPGTPKFDNINLPPQPAVNNAVQFNGAAQAATNGAGQYNLQTFTVEAWAKVQATGLLGSDIVSNGDNYGLRVDPDGELSFSYYTGAGNWTGFSTAGVNLKDGAWHHVAAVKSATSVTLYVDGQLRNTFETSGTISYALGQNLVVGAHGFGDTNFYLNGSVDDIRIWNTARTPAQIVGNWQSEVAAPQSGLVGYWQCNVPSGTTVPDLSGNNHALTLSAGASLAAGFPKQ